MTWMAWVINVAVAVAAGTAFLKFFLPNAPWYHLAGLAFLAAFFIRVTMNIGKD